MRYPFRFIPRSLIAVTVLAAAMVGAVASPVAANSDQGFAKGWTFILEFPTGNRNALAVMALQGGQLAGTAFISGKGCAYKISGTFTGDEEAGGSFAMTWTGQKACAGEVLALQGTVVSDAVTGTFTDTIISGGPFALVGTVVFDDND
jgi:hypothetical protein